MKLIDYLQTDTGKIVTGIILAAVILSTVMLFAILAERKRKPAKDDLWTAEGYYNYLLALVKASRNMEQLEIAWLTVENTWFTKTFRVQVTKFERNKKYAKLCEAYTEIEIDLTQVKVELCTN